MKTSSFKSKLLIAIAAFLLAVFAVYFGFKTLRNYSSSSYVIEESIKNIHKERENTIRSKNIFIDNSEKIKSLGLHIIKSEEEIPYLVSKIEEYAESINTNVTINSIELGEKPKEDSGGSRLLYIDIVANGSFNLLLSLVKMLENADYIIGIEEYYLREVAILAPNRAGGEVVYRDISYTDDSSSIPNKTWFLSAKLVLHTNIK